MRALPEFLQNPDPEIYLEGNYVCLDFETTNLDKGSALNAANHLVLTCWYESADNSHHYNWDDEYSQEKLLEAIARADFLVCHNAKFELHWLMRCGYDVGSTLIYDTMVAEWVIGGNRAFGLLASLDACLKRRDMDGKNKLVSDMISAGVCPSDIPRPWLLKYCRRDVVAARDLMHDQLEEIGDDKRLNVVYTRCLATPVLADIETRGLFLDADLVDAEYNKYLTEYKEVMAELDELTGGINPRSPNQVAGFVYGELGFKEKKDRKGKFVRNKPNKAFPDGAPKTDQATLLSLNPETEDQIRFITLKKQQAVLASALDKNLAMFQGACKERGCHIYGVLNQGTTGTHRLSSSGRSEYYEMFDAKKGCQFQNLPNRFKGLFAARKKGNLVAEVDYSQLEYRMAGEITGDPVIYEEVDAGHDVHRYTASIMYEIPQGEVTYEQRRLSKPDTFKPVYGGVFGTDSQMRYYKAFQEKYHVMHETQNGWCIQVGNDKRLVTPWGMRYYWPEASFRRDGKLNVMTKVFNYPIQAFATAEVVPISLVMFWHRIRDAEMFIINTVHDSIECELPENEIELFAEVAVKALTEDVYRYVSKVYDIQITMTLGLGMVIGTHWTKSSVSEERWNAAAEAVNLPNYHYDDGEVTVSVVPTEEMYV